ncbi:MAG: bifunctional riboflavin kinase/FAD synthetase [Bacteroidetes bacterium]|nr:bifunctional riboflavin kinase/FAD synthetase [Bacteroidota bacterium]
MLSIRHTPEFRIEKPTILTIGTFDGVHIGHKAIIEQLKAVKQQTNIQTCLLTFDPHPRSVLFPNQTDLKLLNTVDEKLELLKKMGLDIVVVYPFSQAFSEMDAGNYINNILLKQLNAKHLVIGYDHHFGKNREGNIKTLIPFSKANNFNLIEINAKDIDNIAVSSSKIRHALLSGDITTANAFLGYPYFFTGSVIKGKQLGRTIGFPTANIKLHSNLKLVPKNGVYFVKVCVKSSNYFGMLNIGTNPTVCNNDTLKIEVNIFNFEADIYNETIKIDFLNYLRNEIKFNDLESLKNAISNDKIESLKLLEKQKNIL